MNKPIIAIASDHAGLEMKSQLLDFIRTLASEVLDVGTKTQESVDYNDYANLLAEQLLKEKAAFGIAICGSGIGMSIALNRHKGIRAALCHEGLSAALSRRHNNANVLCLGARIIGLETAQDSIMRFLHSDFEAGRHAGRVAKLDG